MHIKEYFEGKAGWVLINESALKNIKQRVVEMKEKIGRINDQWLL